MYTPEERQQIISIALTEHDDIRSCAVGLAGEPTQVLNRNDTTANIMSMGMLVLLGRMEAETTELSTSRPESEDGSLMGLRCLGLIAHTRSHGIVHIAVTCRQRAPIMKSLKRLMRRVVTHAYGPLSWELPEGLAPPAEPPTQEPWATPTPHEPQHPIQSPGRRVF